MQYSWIWVDVQGSIAHINSTVTKHQRLFWREKQKKHWFYTNITLDFMGTEINTILLKRNFPLTVRLGDNPTLMTQVWFICYSHVELHYPTVSILTLWKGAQMDWTSATWDTAFLLEVTSPPANRWREHTCYRLLSHYCSSSGVNLRWNYWWFKLSPMLWNFTTEEHIHCLPSKSVLSAAGKLNKLRH